VGNDSRTKSFLLWEKVATRSEPTPAEIVFHRDGCGAWFPMRDFANAAFTPETIAAMERAMESAVASLPEPVSSAHVQMIAESILRAAREGERDPATLERLALLELQIRPRG
jgi:hypothetical protein